MALLLVHLFLTAANEFTCCMKYTILLCAFLGNKELVQNLQSNCN